jgi:hypothetical protein
MPVICVHRARGVLTIVKALEIQQDEALTPIVLAYVQRPG